MHHAYKARAGAVIAFLVAAFLIVPLAFADMQGIDVSGWQSRTVTCTASYDFAIVKTTEGVSYVNPNANAQLDCARNRGKAIGTYHYARGLNAVSEADYYLSHSAGYVRKGILVLDWEAGGNRAWGNGAWIRTWVNRVHDKTGVWPLVYVSASAVSQVPSDVRRNCGLWVAQYASNSATGFQAHPWLLGKYGEAMRQYTSNGRIPGYSGPLDLNVFRGDRSAWDKYANPSNPSTAAPAPSTPAAPAPAPSAPSSTVSVTVRPGDTLSGIAARTGLYPVSAWRVPSGDANRIYPGQVVTFVGSSASATRTVTVRRGDTLSGIAARLGVSPSNITGYRSGNPSLIYPGEVLRY